MEMLGMTTSRGGRRPANGEKRVEANPAAMDADATLADFPDNAAIEVRSRFRTSLRLVASTVALVTAAHDGRRGGLTATAACSLSVDPPLMLVCVNRRSHTHGFMRESERFCINYLGVQHRELAQLFSLQLQDTDAKFALGAWGTSRFGNPILIDSLTTIECSVHRRVDEGTHSIFVGRVLDVTARHECEPLVYVQGGFAGLTPSD
jgi:flavin reductase (DIM6/NTAB) family NADH-FMN oxidoreductase RutF